MFIKVMFGAGCSVLVNTSCRLVNLTAHLRQKAGLPPDATIALLAEDGNLVSLEEDLKEGASRAQTMGNSLLKERTIYVLVRIISKVAQEGEDMASTRYESLLENLDDHYPELAGANRQQPSRTPLAESGIAEKLHQQEGQGP
uniref:Chromosome 22 open reading frame 15 n=1 Tax=Gorilla gorilla gorilla TaxID=9595 RepID=A0A2I2ZEJ0_GORGO